MNDENQPNSEAEATPATTTPTVTASDITPALSKDVDFTAKVNAVDDALKSRSAATKDLKVKWANIIKAFAEFDVAVTARRGDAVAAQNYVHKVEILQPQNPLLDDKDMVKMAREAYDVQNLKRRTFIMSKLEENFAGVTAYMEKIILTSEAANEYRVTDKEATKAAQAKVQPVVDEYVSAIEAYDDTVESVANVKEYIAIVKDVAEISAIAQGSARN